MLMEGVMEDASGRRDRCGCTHLLLLTLLFDGEAGCDVRDERRRLQRHLELLRCSLLDLLRQVLDLREARTIERRDGEESLTRYAVWR